MHAYQEQRRRIIATVLVLLVSGGMLLAGIHWWWHQPIVTISAVGSVEAIAVSPTGQLFASGEYMLDQGSVIHLRHMTDGTILRAIPTGPDILTSIAISADATLLAAGSTDSHIWLWSLDDKSVFRMLHGHTATVTSIAFSPDGQFLASGSTDATVRLWRVRDGMLLQTLQPEVDTFSTPYVAFHPESHLLAAGDFQSITLWSIPDGQIRRTIPNLAVSSLAFSANGRFVLVGQTMPEHEVLVLRVEDWEVIATLDAHANDVSQVATSPAGRLGASASGTAGYWLEHEPADPTIRIWDLPTGTLIKTITAHYAAIEGLAFSHDGRWLISGSADKTIKVWRVPNIHD